MANGWRLAKLCTMLWISMIDTCSRILIVLFGRYTFFPFSDICMWCSVSEIPTTCGSCCPVHCVKSRCKFQKYLYLSFIFSQLRCHSKFTLYDWQEKSHLTSDILLDASSNQFTAAELRKMEQLMLAALDWRLFAGTFWEENGHWCIPEKIITNTPRSHTNPCLDDLRSDLIWA